MKMLEASLLDSNPNEHSNTNEFKKTKRDEGMCIRKSMLEDMLVTEEHDKIQVRHRIQLRSSISRVLLTMGVIKTSRSCMKR